MTLVRAVVGRLPVPVADALRRRRLPGPIRRGLYAGGIPRGVATFRLVDDPSLEFVAADSMVLTQLYWWGGQEGWEPELLPWWRAFCRNSRSVVELGTNVGYFAVQGGRAAPNGSGKRSAAERVRDRQGQPSDDGPRQAPPGGHSGAA